MSVRIFIKFGYRTTRSTLSESLQSKVYISSDSFNRMLLSGKFHYYAYDSRCNQLLWLSQSGTWLFVEVVVHE